MRSLLVVAALVAAASGTPAVSPTNGGRFRADDPLLVDDDRIPIAKPQEIEFSNFYDFLEHTYAHRPDEPIPRAADVNTLGEVPDSSWFTNRIGVRPMSVDEIVRGARSVDGPTLDEPWAVVGGKSNGLTPGFTIRDGRGDVYFIKFDPVSYPNLSTSVDVISSLFFHAFGYNVTENYIARFRRDQLRVAEGARVRGEGGKKRAMVEADVDALLQSVKRGSDGTYRCVASKRLEGEPIGPFKYWGTRPDDGNDIFPHEHRRELRGLRVFAAWLNHDDSRSINSLDMFLKTAADAGYVRHHLIDFSSTLGSGSNPRREIAPQERRAGNEYLIERGPTVRSLLSLGLIDRPWRGVPYPDLPEIGRFEAEFYQPNAWRPEYPNPAFERMRNDDAFWAAQILARITDPMIEAVVAAGEYDDPKSVAYLIATLIKRRDKTVDYYFTQLAPLADFRLTGGGLAFANLGEARDLGVVDGYDVQWFGFDNASGALTELGSEATVRDREVALPRASHEFMMLRIRTRSGDQPNWGKAIDVYIRVLPEPHVVGIEREI